MSSSMCSDQYRRSNEKWLTDVTKFKYGTGNDEKQEKIYLSVIIDLCGKHPVAYEYSDHNDNTPVFNTFDKAGCKSRTKPLFHSNRRYQYTSKTFRQKIIDAEMAQRMSRISKYMDNAPIEGFWRIIKREMCYGENTKPVKR